MSKGQVTTAGGMLHTVEDVTYRGGRKQSEVGAEMAAEAQKLGLTTNTISVDLASNVPQSVTMESAIQYFKTNASGVNKALYSFAAKQLTRLLTLDNKQKEEQSRKANGVVSSEVNTEL